MLIPLVEKGSPTTIQISIFAFTALLSLVWSAGLFCYKRWARLLGLLTIVFVVLPMPGDPQSFSWLHRYFYDISVFSTGAMLAMAFFSSVKHRFVRISTEPFAGGNAATPRASA